MDRGLIDKYIGNKLREKKQFDDYLDELFKLSKLVIFGYLKENDLIGRMFLKFTENFDVEDLLFTNPNFYVRIKYILKADEIMNKRAYDFNDTFLENSEFSSLDSYYNEKLKEFLNLENSAYIYEKRIEKLMSNIDFVGREMFPYIDFYILSDFNRDNYDRYKSYLFYRIIAEKNYNLLSYNYMRLSRHERDAFCESLCENMDNLDLSSLILLKWGIENEAKRTY